MPLGESGNTRWIFSPANMKETGADYRVDCVPNVRVIHLAWRTSRGRGRLNCTDQSAPTSLKRSISFCGEGRRETYDVVHSHYWLSAWVGQRLSQEASTFPHMVTFHTLGSHQDAVTGRRGGTGGKFEVVEREVDGNRPDRIVAFSNHERDAMERLYGADPAKSVTPGTVRRRSHKISSDGSEGSPQAAIGVEW